jgi:hypothetical protein
MVTCLVARFYWCCVWITQKQIAKFKALIVCGVLGSVFVIGVMLRRVFNFGDVFWRGSDVNKPTCWKACLIL